MVSTFLWMADALPLVLAHLLGDFVFQTAAMVAQKHRWRVLLGHSAVVAGLSYGLLGRWGAWEVPLVIFVTHAGIDYGKVRSGLRGSGGFLLDQLAHGLVIGLLVWVGVRGGGGEVSLWMRHGAEAWSRVVVVLAGAILCVRTGGVLIGYWVQPYLHEIKAAVRPLMASRGLTGGGWIIGQWERALIFLFVAVGQPGAIGFLIAAKSIFRFGELKDRENRMEAEYITIGTLMSFGWAMTVAYLTWWLADRV